MVGVGRNIYRKLMETKSWITKMNIKTNPIFSTIIGIAGAISPKVPQTIMDQNSSLWESYQCPAGSLVIFSEATTHSAQEWTDENVDRIPVFNQYNGIGSRFHWWEPPTELLETMPEKRQSLFRHAYGEEANTGLATRNLFEKAVG